MQQEACTEATFFYKALREAAFMNLPWSLNLPVGDLKLVAKYCPAHSQRSAHYEPVEKSQGFKD